MSKLLVVVLLLLSWSIPIKVRAELRFSEIYASPDINEYEWYELYNDSDEAINLSNFSLSREKAGKIYRPELLTATAATVAAHSYFVAVPEYALPNTGGTLLLYNQNQELISQLTYPALQRKQSYAYFPDLEPHWQVTNQLTPKKANHLATPPPSHPPTSSSGATLTKTLPAVSSKVAVISSPPTPAPSYQVVTSAPTNTPHYPHNPVNTNSTQPTEQKTTIDQQLSQTFHAGLALPQLEIVTSETTSNSQQPTLGDNKSEISASASGAIRHLTSNRHHSFFLSAGIAVIISGITLLFYQHHLNTENNESDYNYLQKI